MTTDSDGQMGGELVPYDDPTVLSDLPAFDAETAIEQRRLGDAGIAKAIANVGHAIDAIRGLPCEALVYEFRVGQGQTVSGMTVQAMRTLAAYAGNFLVEVTKPEQTTYTHAWLDGDGELQEEDVPAWIVLARATNNNNALVIEAWHTEPKVKLSRKKDRTGAVTVAKWVDNHADTVAQSKAKRKAIGEHFAPVLPVLKELVLAEKKAKGDGAFFMGDPASARVGEAEDAATAREAGARQRASAGTVKLGHDRAEAWKARVRDLGAAMQADGDDPAALWQAYHDFVGTWEGLDLKDIPEADWTLLEQWIETRENEWGEKPDDDPDPDPPAGGDPAPAAEEKPEAPPDDEERQPHEATKAPATSPGYDADGQPINGNGSASPDDAEQILISFDELADAQEWSVQKRAALKRSCGIKRDKPVSVNQARALWDLAEKAIQNEAGKASAGKLLE